MSGDTPRYSRRSLSRTRMSDVARLANVSTITVSRALRQPEKVSEDTLERIQAAIEDTGYVPHRIAGSLRSRSTRIVGLFVPDAGNEFCAAMAESLERALQAENMVMLLCNVKEDPNRQDQYIEEMLAYDVRAIVLLGAVDSPRLRALERDDLPMVYIVRRPPQGLGGHFVGIDDLAAGRQIAGALVSGGHERIGVIHGPLYSQTSSLRLQGFLDRLKEAGITPDPELIHEAGLTITDGYRIAAHILDRPDPPSALFCGNDLIAYGAHKRCLERGMAVPGDITLFGFDDNPLNAWLAPWLNTVRIPLDLFGSAILDILKAEWAGRGGPSGPKLLEHSLVLRTL